MAEYAFLSIYFVEKGANYVVKDRISNGFFQNAEKCLFIIFILCYNHNTVLCGEPAVPYTHNPL